MAEIDKHFHALIRSRAGALVDEHQLTLPAVQVEQVGEESSGWFPVPGMYGGFKYWLEIDQLPVRLVCESWSRIVGGSGQRHEITAEGTALLEEGFV